MATKTQKELSRARISLSETLAAQKRAKAIVDNAQRVVDAASAALEHARAELARFDESHEDVVKSRLAALKGERAKTPDEIREARRARLLAQEEVLEGELVLAAAKAELAEARGYIAASEKTTASAVTSVIGESVTDIVAQWDRINGERERVRTVLQALILAAVPLDTMSANDQNRILSDAASKARLPYGDVHDWKSLQNRVGLSLNHNFAQADPGPSIAKARAFWARYADSLLNDPAAELPTLPGSSELF